MNILIIGENNFNSLERIYKKNFLILNCKKVDLISPWKPKNNFLKKILNFQEKYFFEIYSVIQNYLLKIKLNTNKISYDIIIVFNGYHFDKKIISLLKKRAQKSLINIQTDNIFIKKNILKLNIKMFDRIYVWSKSIQNKINKKLKIKKNKICFLPFGFDQTLLKTIKRQNISKSILFYGSWDKNREELLNQINPKLIRIYGNGWNNAKYYFKKNYNIKGELIGDNLKREISKSLLSLNLFRDQAKNLINMRSFEVLGYNGTLLSEYSEEQTSFFKNFKSIIYFKNIKEINNIFKKINSKKKIILKFRKKDKLKINKHSYLSRAKYILRNEKNFF